MIVSATATVAAAITGQFLFAGQASQFQGLVHILMDGLLNLMQLLLRIKKITSNRVLQKRVPVLLKIGDFFPSQGRRHLLFLLQNLPLADQTIIVPAGFFVRHESVDPPADGLHVRLVKDGLAELPGFLHDRRFFDRRWHSLLMVSANAGLSHPWRSVLQYTTAPSKKQTLELANRVDPVNGIELRWWGKCVVRHLISPQIRSVHASPEDQTRRLMPV